MSPSANHQEDRRNQSLRRSSVAQYCRSRWRWWALVALLACSVCGFFWYRQWAWGHQSFDGPRGKVIIQIQGERYYATRRDVLEEARTRFTFQGKPIHPAIINAFSRWLSDRHTTVLAVDVAGATDSNQYGQPVRTYETGFHEVVLETEPDTGRESTFGYTYLGTLDRGVHVLETMECGGGTGRFYNLLLLRCDVASVAGKDRLMLKFVDTFALGDRFMGEIEFKGNRIAIRANPLNQYTGLQEDAVFRPNLKNW